MQSETVFSKTIRAGKCTGILVLFVFVLLLLSCSSQKNQKAGEEPPEPLSVDLGEGPVMEIRFQKGPHHNHPLMAFWLEDSAGRLIQTIYVAKSIGTGIFGHGQITDGHWEPGPVSRPAALPYWWHKYGFLPDKDRPVPDAITGPTPKENFVLTAKLPKQLPETFVIVMEINQSWDWNEYWTNVRFPENEAYMSSSQPALIYKARVNTGSAGKEYRLELAGHSHYAGENGQLYENTESLTTAKDIVGEVMVRFSEQVE